MSEDINVKIDVHASNGPGILCKVCGDRASGKHYGVPSCDGCRGFFKRSIRRNLEYVCKEGGRCVVDVSRRNQCQACRFSKCLQANMRREAVQHERAPRTYGNRTSISGLPGLSMDLYNVRRLSMTSNGLFLPMPLQHIANTNDNQYTTAPEAQKYFPAFPPTGYMDTLPFRSVPNDFAAQKLFNSGKINSLSQNIFGNSLFTQRISPFSTIPAPAPCLTLPNIPPDTLKTAKDDEVTSSEEHHSGITFLSQPTSHQISNASNKEAVFESAAKLLFLAVQWARAVPSFAQLPNKDQKLLLEESWAELFVITAAQWGLTMDFEFMSKEIGAKRLQKAINHFIGLRIDHTEAACLKALILFKSDCCGLVSTNQVAFLQDQTLNLLHEQCGGTRLGHILLLLPTVKLAADPQTLQELLFKRTVGEVAIERLLGDLIKT